jgi:diaminopimelate decarboxylase
MKNISGNPFIIKKDGNIYLEDISLNEIVKRYKTPILIFLENRIRGNMKTFNNIFNSVFDDFRCYYSFKANYLSEICKIALSEGIGAEIVGLPELKLALKLGFPTNKILVGGPYLPKELIEVGIRSKIKEFIIYDLKDLKKVNSIAQKYNYIQDICIRVNSQKYKSKLGVKLDEKKMIEFARVYKNYQNLRITTLLSHYGTQMNNINQFKKNISSIAQNMKLLSDHGVIIDNINLGGGFPEATIMPQNQLNIIARDIKSTLERLQINYKSIYFEPGRYFMGDAGLFISKIVKVEDERWIFLDIGNHVCPKFARCSLRFYNASQIDNPHKYKTSIAGIIPTDQDVLAKDYFFTEELHKGDKILVTNVGAYCLTFSNRFPYLLPKIILINRNSLKEIFNPDIDGDFSLN